MGNQEIRAAGERELALFQAGDIICGLDTFHVREINNYTGVTVVHRAPEYIRGVINLRGEICTIFDLRVKFSLPPADNQTIHALDQR